MSKIFYFTSLKRRAVEILLTSVEIRSLNKTWNVIQKKSLNPVYIYINKDHE